MTYEKSNFIKGDIDPTMYFNCVDNNTGIEYNKQSEDIEYIINFSQKIKVNTEADEAFNIYLGRNVDDLVNAVQNVLDINDQISKIESMQKEGQYSDEASQKKLSDIMEGLTKQRDFAKSKMKDAFEAGIGQMQGYQEQVSNAKADVGNRQIRLDLTKTRLTEQKTNFTDLKSQNRSILIWKRLLLHIHQHSLYIRQHYQLRARLFSRHCLISLGSQHKRGIQ